MGHRCWLTTVMAASNDEILADFQACTGIDDVEECIVHLEEAGWNLLDALNRVMPKETQALPSERRLVAPMELHHCETPLQFRHDGMTAAPVAGGGDDDDDVVVPLPSTSANSPRLVTINVQHCGSQIPVAVPVTDTIGAVKKILTDRYNIPTACRELRSWDDHKIPEHTKLSALSWPNGMNLFLSVEVPAVEDSPSSSSSERTMISERMKQNFTLNIADETNKKDYSLCFQGNATIAEVKQAVYTLTNIISSQQCWTGWPERATGDSMTLAGAGIGYPCHSLAVRKLVPPPKEVAHQKDVVVDLVSDSSSAEEFEDASESFSIEDIFLQDMPTKKLLPLMSPSVEDEYEAIGHFSQEFSARYGDFHPVFFQGNLNDALQEACNRPARERKLLAVYLHHDGSVLSNVFCTQLLCAETVVPYLTSNFITWAWDVTCEANRARFLTAVTQHFGAVAATTIRGFSLEQLPALLIIMKVRSTTEIFTVIHGNVSLEELMARLVNTVEVFGGQQQIECIEEEAREAREQVKREQDAAYEASLQADRAKEEARRQEVELRQRVEVEREKERDRLERERLRDEAAKEAIRDVLKKRLPEEPSEECGFPVSHIRVRLPSGQFITRRFLAHTPLRVLLDFLSAEGFSPVEYKALTSWPRRDLTTLDADLTFGELKLFPQETITLEERTSEGPQ